jgi:hypothetical protein
MLVECGVIEVDCFTTINEYSDHLLRVDEIATEACSFGYRYTELIGVDGPMFFELVSWRRGYIV